MYSHSGPVQEIVIYNRAITALAGSPMYDNDEFDGYTIRQVVGALRTYGLLA